MGPCDPPPPNPKSHGTAAPSRLNGIDRESQTKLMRKCGGGASANITTSRETMAREVYTQRYPELATLPEKSSDERSEVGQGGVVLVAGVHGKEEGSVAMFITFGIHSLFSQNQRRAMRSGRLPSVISCAIARPQPHTPNASFQPQHMRT